MNGARDGGLYEKPVECGQTTGDERVDEDLPKIQSTITSAFPIARLNATSCASDAIGKDETEIGGGAMRGSPRFSHCFLSR